ncbi:hypothetical protein EV363DRAFT_1337946 [Boletus edulis]|uniref:DUF6593 domain-containing protein n=1 Tax=Boletus edulis BED1 TaxID=1328754 RepID=A0AAD4BQS4_BOLED|nr:hypothetical protein EV363DRAFT_1224541 [Boletus edulis]KAF8129174.1 hypothetical protein EV363DRAFT_1337946 [Boletus edulis]KAF8437500.1 hypothetical protein L210DRAFT_3622174 [Boletus edulis BED1]
MNFSLAQDSPFNTALVSPEGRVLYRIETPSFLSPSSMTATTTVKRVSMDGLSEAEVGRVVWQSGRPGTVVVHGHELSINKSKFFSSSRTFTALNGQSYKWSFENDSSLMASNDSKQAPAATYLPSTRSNPGLIHITPHGLTITGDVFVTFVCVEGERRNAQRRKT